MKPPNIKKIKIGSSWYSVKYVNEILNDKGKHILGDIYSGTRRIRVDKENSYQTMLQVIQHESTHGICWEYNINDKEKIVTPLSNGFYAFIIDNPLFIKEILKHAERMRK